MSLRSKQSLGNTRTRTYPQPSAQFRGIVTIAGVGFLKPRYPSDQQMLAEFEVDFSKLVSQKQLLCGL
jgi:hypothetical protein